MADQLFPLGRISMTTNLQGQIQEANPEGWEAELQRLIRRHVSGDWGDLDDEDKQENQLSLERGHRIFSAYDASENIRVWVITEADRSASP